MALTINHTEICNYRQKENEGVMKQNLSKTWTCNHHASNNLEVNFPYESLGHIFVKQCTQERYECLIFETTLHRREFAENGAFTYLHDFLKELI